MEKPLLDPRVREIYLDHLRPPEGYRLHYAVATTFSLDLMSLLMAPIAMALRDQKVQSRSFLDPVVVMEAIQRSADRVAVFCQKGRIALPQTDTLLYSFLERSVIEAQSPNPEGVFHPKTWLLRYTGEEASPIIYRFLCLSRNLTFDNSWDTILSLEGTLAEHRSRGYGANRPLGDFHQALPRLATGRVPKRIQEFVSQMADEVRRVQFEPPEGFDSIDRYIPIGIDGYKDFPPVLEGCKKALLLSPFVSPGGIERVTRSGDSHILISRPESFDSLSRKTLEKMSEATSFYYMDEAAERPEETDTSENPDGGPNTFSGLHAKLILAENGTQVTVYTGSANLTSAAFAGRNVEFMVGLSGLRKFVGIEQFLGDEDAKFAFRNMLHPYKPPEKRPETTELQRLENDLEKARTALAGTEFKVRVEPSHEENTFDLRLLSAVENIVLPPGITCRCFPATLPEHRGRDITILSQGGEIAFRGLTTEALTSFIGFQLRGKRADVSAGSAFVLNLPAEGMPKERNKSIVSSILSNREHFIRYLLLILGQEAGNGIASWLSSGKEHYSGHSSDVIPLFEEMVRAYSREPEKIQRIGRIISDIRDSGKLEAILPEGFENMWKAFSNRKIKESEL